MPDICCPLPVSLLRWAYVTLLASCVVLFGFQLTQLALSLLQSWVASLMLDTQEGYAIQGFPCSAVDGERQRGLRAPPNESSLRRAFRVRSTNDLPVSLLNGARH